MNSSRAWEAAVAAARELGEVLTVTEDGVVISRPVEPTLPLASSTRSPTPETEEFERRLLEDDEQWGMQNSDSQDEESLAETASSSRKRLDLAPRETAQGDGFGAQAQSDQAASAKPLPEVSLDQDDRNNVWRPGLCSARSGDRPSPRRVLQLLADRAPP